MIREAKDDVWPSPGSRRSSGGRSGQPTFDRVNKENQRRTDVVGEFANSEALPPRGGRPGRRYDE